jgi:hypothetical protein
MTLAPSERTRRSLSAWRAKLRVLSNRDQAFWRIAVLNHPDGGLGSIPAGDSELSSRRCGSALVGRACAPVSTTLQPRVGHVDALRHCERTAPGTRCVSGWS